ncbi:hypothetical protein RhiJN_26377 [Ceratobasidium sp. AG-Ba]|nr:hypothetical protein RhiJN_26377 [Ceratobasidium sp. AG-Ba]
MSYKSLKIVSVLFCAGLCYSTPASFEKSLPYQVTAWTNQPQNVTELICGSERFATAKIIDTMELAVRLEDKQLYLSLPDGHQYPHTFDSNRIQEWVNWPKRADPETDMCGGWNGQVVLYPISNTDTTGPYRVAISKKFRVKSDSRGGEVRTYAFCGLVYRIKETQDYSYFMCNNYPWSFGSENGRDMDEEYEQFLLE